MNKILQRLYESAVLAKAIDPSHSEWHFHELLTVGTLFICELLPKSDLPENRDKVFDENRYDHNDRKVN